MKRQRRTGVSWTGALLFFLMVAAIVSAAFYHSGIWLRHSRKNRPERQAEA